MEEDQLDAWRTLTEMELLQYIELIQLLTKFRNEYDSKKQFSYTSGRFFVIEHETPEFIYAPKHMTHDSVIRIAKCLQTKGYHCFVNDIRLRINWDPNVTINSDVNVIVLLATHKFV